MEGEINAHVYMYITIAGKQIPFITDAVVVTWVLMAIIMVGVLLLTRNLKTVPTGRQKFVEMVVEQINNLCANQLGKYGKVFAPYIGTVLIYLAFSNLCGLFNIFPTGETLAAVFNNPALANFHFSMHPPTKNFNVTLCLAVMSIVLVIGTEFRYMGIKGWLRSFYTPTPISGFVKILDFFVRPLSLCLRLFGNIMGGTIVMALVYSAIPLILPAIIAVYFDLFDGLLQAYVFVFLTMIYLSEALEEAEHLNPLKAH